MRAICRPVVLALALGAGCAPAGSGSGSAATPEPEAEVEREPFRVLAPRERVPPFRVVSTDGRSFDSDALIGKEPFVLVFFASWCRVCDMKLPVVAEVLAASKPVAVLAVALDDTDTWQNVPRFVQNHALTAPVIRAQSFPRFTLAYDPLQTVPVVAVVGRNGYLVDYQIGYSITHRARLAAALEVARRIPADAPPFLNEPGPALPDAPDPE